MALNLYKRRPTANTFTYLRAYGNLTKEENPTRSFSWWDFFVDNNSELINLKIWRQLGIGCLQNIKQVYLMSRILMFIGIAYRSFCVSVEIVWTTGNTEVGIIVHVYWYEVAYHSEFLLVFVMVYHTSWWKLEGETPSCKNETS